MSRRVWADVVNKHVKALSTFDQQRVSRLLGYAEFQAEIGGMFANYTNQGATQCLQRLKPVFDHLNNFTQVIGTMVQSNPAIAALVWGSIMIILNVSRRSLESLEYITGLLLELRGCMPLFERYLDLYPRRPDLQDSIRDIYDSYVGFLICAITWCERSWFPNLFSPLAWKGGINKQMEEAKSRIKTQKAHFDDVQHVVAHELINTIQRAVAPQSQSVNVINTLDVLPNSFFCGRVEILQNLYNALRPSNKPGLRACVLHGVGGAGKTQTAMRYIYEHEHEYSHIFWVRAEEPAQIAKSFCEIASRASISGQISSNQQQNIEAALNWLNKTDKTWLLVFDNVVMGSHIKKFLPKTNGSVIFTTQSTDVAQIFSNTIAVKAFGSKEGAELLQKHLQQRKEKVSECEEISELVGGLPLSIAHIAGSLARSGTTLAEFKDIYPRPELSTVWNGTGQTTSDYERSLETAFDFALKALSVDAREFLDTLAFLDPDCMQEDMVFRLPPDPANPGKTILTDTAMKMKLREALRGRHLVESTPISDPSLAHMVMHRSVKRSLLLHLDRNQSYKQATFEKAVRLVRQVIPPQSPESTPTNNDWPRYEKYQAHVLSLCTIYNNELNQVSSSNKLEGTMEFAELLSDVGNYMWERYLLVDAFKVLDIAKYICEQVVRCDDTNPVRTQVVYLIASFELNYGSTKRRDGLNNKMAIVDLRERRFKAFPRGQAPRVDKLQLSTAYNNLGGAFLHCDDYEKAEVLLQRSLDIKRECCDEGSDEDSFHFAESYKNLAICAMSKGDFQVALELSGKAINMLEKWSKAGPKTKTVLLHRFLRASHYYNAGKTDAALLENIRILKLREEVLGKAHDHTLDSYFAVGYLSYVKGDFNEAKLHLENCLGARQYYYESRVPRVVYVLALVYEAMGIRQEASRFRQEAQDLRDQFVPAGCPGIDLGCGDDLRIYDQMVNIWSGRFSGKQNHVWQKLQASQTTTS